MIIDFLKFEINNNLYELTGVHLLEYNGWTYDVVNRTNGTRKIMSEGKLKDLLKKYEYKVCSVDN